MISSIGNNTFYSTYEKSSDFLLKGFDIEPCQAVAFDKLSYIRYSEVNSASYLRWNRYISISAVESIYRANSEWNLDGASLVNEVNLSLERTITLIKNAH